ncbi:MAG: sodium:solute symporter family protein [Calditrichia bacterium]
MNLTGLDWSIIIAFFVLSLGVGLAVARKAGSSSSEFFLSGRNMPWWLLGVSMVATTFSADTPNLVTDIVRQNGVAGNWVWWAFLLTGMLTVFVYAKLWRRSGASTDLEFYEMRYSGKPAAFLRGFRAIYLGVVFNVLIMATVTLAMIKIAGILLGLSPVQTVVIGGTITVTYSALGGLRGVIITDFFQFIIAMIGAIGAAVVAVQHPDVGSLSNLLTHENVVDSLSLLPSFSDTDMVISLLIIPLAVQWWSIWYPGAEPGGGGYVAQRMLSAKSERHAIGATFLFNVAHYALRPWPWIIVALCSMIVFPDLQSLREAFPNIDDSIVGHDLAYPAMLSFLPQGLLGLVVASLIAAYMSTISTHLNWGASYLVNDFYKRFINPTASESQQVNFGRLSTVGLMILASLFALALSDALGAFQILLQIGAGTGLLFILRWFWWRINAFSEITAMTVSFLIAIYFQLAHEQLGFEAIPSQTQFLFGVGMTTICWIIATYLTRTTDRKTLFSFYKLVQPGGPGWKGVMDQAAALGESLEPTGRKWDVPQGVLMMLLGSVGVYAALFATGSLLYGETTQGSMLIMLSLICGGGIAKLWQSMVTD